MSTLDRALGLALEMRQPFLLWGDPQLGKSKRIEALARAYDRPCFVDIASLREPTDYGGLPALVDERDAAGALTGRKVMRFYPMEKLRRVVLSGHGILFLDELPNADLNIQKVLMAAVLDRTFGDLVLPAAVSIAAAGNPPESAAGTGELTPALASRMLHFDVEPDLDEFVSGSESGWTDPEVLRLPAHWNAPERLRVATRFVTSFLRRKPALLHAMPKPGTRELSRGWPGYRTWSMVMLIEAACQASGAEPAVQRLMLQGAVGVGAEHELNTYRQDMGLPDPEAVLKDPSLIRDENRQDRIDRILEGALALALKRMKSTTETTRVETAGARAWNQAWNVLAAVAVNHADLAVGHAQRLLAAPEIYGPNNVPRFQVPAERIGALFGLINGEVL